MYCLFASFSFILTCPESNPFDSRRVSLAGMTAPRHSGLTGI